ncbi:hypothetical protein PLESTF_001030900 [Pleodorina starrii]|nr:hypothetical protein PLESTF_001030900 [Pleodorina starrii]
MVEAEPLWTLQIKHGAQQLELSLPASAKVQELQERLQELTGAFVRKQKLIFKGKVLAATHDLAKAGLANGAKLMLLLSDGTAVATQGQQALQQQKKARQDEAAARVRELYAQAKGGALGGAAAAAVAAAAAPAARKEPAIDWAERKRTWEKTAIISLRDLGLSTLPDDLFASGLDAARVADLSHNALARLPPSISRLTGLHTLRLERNCLGTGAAAVAACGSAPGGSGASGSGSGGEGSAGLAWEALGALSGLTCLSLDHNGLEALPDAGISGLRSLQVLSVSHNALTALPQALGQLGALQVLLADSNRLEALPDSIGGCSSLVELSAEGNRIRELPPGMAGLNKLQSARLDGNMIAAVPPAVLRDCASLSSLSLQGNPITADQLRSTPGFAAYDARRVARCNKQLDAGVLLHASRTFTEGAEDRQWSRWAGGGGGGGGGGAGK